MKSLFQEIDALQAEINALRPFDEFKKNQIKEYFRIGLTYSSNALEGNSLTETETKIVLEEGITIGGKRLVDHMEAIGLSDAYNCMYECVKEKQLTEDQIKKLHWLFYYRIDEKMAGVYRDVQVYITGSEYPVTPPQEIDFAMKEMFSKFERLRAEKHPVEFAAIAHKDFVFIHPFIDGNGRVARLLMNIILMQYGYTITIIPPIMRAEYIRSLEKAHTDDTDFITLIARMIKETQRDFLRLFR